MLHPQPEVGRGEEGGKGRLKYTNPLVFRILLAEAFGSEISAFLGGIPIKFSITTTIKK